MACHFQVAVVRFKSDPLAAFFERSARNVKAARGSDLNWTKVADDTQITSTVVDASASKKSLLGLHQESLFVNLLILSLRYQGMWGC